MSSGKQDRKPLTSEGDTVGDTVERERALDPACSFIVQAPAGSGKTTLLVQRILVLLAGAAEPEEVAAITFTRKAASEMRSRLQEALALGKLETPPDDPARKRTWELARRVWERELRRSPEDRWELDQNPGRLRLTTIDAFCQSVNTRFPLASLLGGRVDVNPEPEDLYTEAARAVFQELEGSSPVSRALEALLFHLDNRAATLERMLCSMLTRRDQWLRHLSPDPKGDKDAGGLRQRLERARAGVIREGLAEACRELTDALKSTLPAGSGEGVEDSISLLAALMDHAATQAGGGEGAPELELLASLQGLPPAEPEALPGWRALAGMLLTGTGDWRKKLSRAQGFPVKDSSGATPGGEAYLRRRKGEMEALLDTLRENLNPESLDAVRMLPDEKYTDGQWEILRALLVLLPRAVEHLGRAFAAAGQVDFIEVSRAALRALEGAGTAAGVTTGGSAGGTAGDTVGDAGGGTWGGLAAVGIRHLLLDEFQDTSTSQHELVTRLTRGWSSAGDNPPTLFLVGDPMQSIYGFREAEVGLFLQARSRGIGGLRLEPLTLRVNFRSRRPVVNWVNEHFPAVLAPRESVAEGAVTFTPSEAFRGAESGGVSIHPVLYNTGTQEPAGQEGPEGEDRRVRMARLVVRLAAEARRENPGGSVAVLVHARSHLTEIVPALRQAGISFQAVGIDPLASRPAVSDLLCLTRALLHPADRVAWLALLRGPLCGLLLSDLLRLCPAGEQGPEHLPLLNEALGDGALLEGISPDGRARLERVAGVLGEARQNRERRSLRRWVEGVWLALGGPAGLLPGEELQAKAFLDHLENTFGGGQLPSRAELEAGLEKLYAPPDVNADGRLLLMTIHQAKGLEFDTVILPALERRSRPDDPPLLIWHERPTGPSRNGGEDPGGLLLAPIGEKGGGEDSLYSYLKRLRRDKRSHEAGRLLYVGATRARERLHLLACCGVKDGALVNPSANSPLHRLWGAFGPAAWKLLEQGPGGADSAGPGRVASELTDTPSRGNLRRLPSGWSLPAAPAAVMAAQGEGFPSAEPEAEAGMPVIEFNWAGEVARHVGTLVHSLLQCAAQEGLERWTPGYARGLRESNRRALAALGTPEAQLEDALDRVGRALTFALDGQRGRWILAHRPGARSEFALAAVIDGQPRHLVIDRTFVDEDGVRWIIDYKTSAHLGGDLETFLKSEQERYRPQLERYAAAFRLLEPDIREVRLGLYFPLLDEWVQWEPRSPAGN